MFEKTGCDAVMCGRATMKNPWIFRQIADLLSGRPARDATLAERHDLMLGHFGQIERLASEPREALHKLRTMTGWYTHGLPNGRALRVRISELSTPADFRSAVEDFFTETPDPVAATA
jgi:tRNA-dihydrouridine synthase